MADAMRGLAYGTGRVVVDKAATGPLPDAEVPLRADHIVGISH